MIATLLGDEADRFALESGRLLEHGYQRNKYKYPAWVRNSTPFTPAEAGRLRAIWLAYSLLPESVTVDLPRPSMAMTYTFEWYSPSPITSATTEFSNEDIVVGGLLGMSADNLSPDIRARLNRWLQSPGTSDV